MTIREYVERRRKLAGAVIALWVIAIVVCRWVYPSYWHAHVGRGNFWFVVSMVALVAVLGLIQWHTRCPRCGATFPDRINAGRKIQLWIEISDQCPRCRVSLDEPMKPAEPGYIAR
jgi:hypothetical protein